MERCQAKLTTVKFKLSTLNTLETEEVFLCFFFFFFGGGATVPLALPLATALKIHTFKTSLGIGAFSLAQENWLH